VRDIEVSRAADVELWREAVPRARHAAGEEGGAGSASAATLRRPRGLKCALFTIDDEVLLYDVTGTCFEDQARDNPLAQRWLQR
jgi:hypothetical protein